MQLKKADRQLLMLLGVLACLVVLWWALTSGSGGGEMGGGGPTSTGVVADSTSSPRPTGSASPSGSASPTSRKPTRSGTASPRPSGEATPVSGLATIAESQLPSQARDTLELIRAGGPYPYRADDGVFGNREGILPPRARGYYREYTVVTPGSDDRGARRIIGGSGGDRYYTQDHYDSFRQILEGR